MPSTPRLLTRTMRPSRDTSAPHIETPDAPTGGYSPPPLMSKKPGPLWRWTKRLLKLAMLGLVLLVGVAAGSYAWFSRELPSVEELRTWRPPQVTKVNCRDGSICAEFYKERRTWVDVTKLPKHVRESFLAAEDADFYSHSGLDYAGILRSAVKNLKPGGMKSGASTISQQACRALLLTQERTLSRKIREWILTPRMERALGKDQVLNLYVNTIYFGHSRYGIEEAALFYFGKHASQLTLGESAVLVGAGCQYEERGDCGPRPAHASFSTARSPAECCARRTFLSNLPTLVLGTSAMNVQRSGSQNLAVRSASQLRNSAAVTAESDLRTTHASGRSSHFGCGIAITAASATFGCAMIMFSRSTDEIHSPPDFTRSLVRSMI